MRPDHLEKLNLWFTEQLAALKAEGASERDLKAGDVADLALRRIFEEHFDQLRGDEEFMKEAFAALSEKTLPEDLRYVLKKAVAVYARGGAYDPGTGAEGYDLQSKTLGGILGFIGVT